MPYTLKKNMFNCKQMHTGELNLFLNTVLQRVLPVTLKILGSLDIAKRNRQRIPKPREPNEKTKFKLSQNEAQKYLITDNVGVESYW